MRIIRCDKCKCHLEADKDAYVVVEWTVMNAQHGPTKGQSHLCTACMNEHQYLM